MKNRMRELRTCGSVRGEGREVLTYSDTQSAVINVGFLRLVEGATRHR